MKDFELVIASSQEREKLTCEIYFKGDLLAEISQETDELLIEIYSCRKEKWWEISLDKFQRVIEVAKKKLLYGNA